MVSRHGSGCPMEIGVTTPFFEVATWAVLVGQKGGRDLSPRPGRYARDLRTLSTRPVLAVHVTSARPVGCAHCSAHNLGTARAVCERPRFWVCALCTQPSFVTVHCSGSLFMTLFMNTVHRDLKKKYKNFKKIFVYDLKYNIFIL